MKLKDIQCRNSKPKEKAYKLADGAGAYLEAALGGSNHLSLMYDFFTLRSSFIIQPNIFCSSECRLYQRRGLVLAQTRS